MNLSGEVAVVTGGSRGIGRATALALAAEGASVVVNYRENEAAATRVVAEILEAGGTAAAVRADIGDPAQAAALIDEAVSRFGKIDILVNNAGVTRSMLLLTTELADLDALYRTNILGTYCCTQAAARVMIQQRHGRIINLSSVVAHRPNKGQGAYAATKGAVESLTACWAVELGTKGITVNAVAPGMIETEMTTELREMAGAEIRERVALRRWGLPADVAAAVVYLASKEAAYVTGSVLTVDGGARL